MKNILEISKLSKWYGENKVLDDVNITIKEGEIHGIVGANGSGKSTLMNILFGKNVIARTGGYEGHISYLGDRYAPVNSSEALNLGIGMIHQELALLPEMTIYENIKLMRENTKSITDRFMTKEYSFLDKKTDIDEAANLLGSLGIDADVKEKVMNISGSLKQFVEICRELDNSELKLILFDEPTAALGSGDSEQLLKTIKNLSSRGIAVVFISHRLDEILEVCHRITVLRDGKVISTSLNMDTDIDKLSYDMMGTSVWKASSNRKEKPATNQVLSLRDFSVKMKGEEIRSMDLDIYESEIIGVTSLSGQGKLALGYGLMGSCMTGGQVTFLNNVYDTSKNVHNVKSGMIFLSDERKISGLLLSRSIMDNIVFTASQIDDRYLKRVLGIKTGFIDHKKAKEDTLSYIESFDIKCNGPHQNTGELSGGNQQKVCLARGLAAHPKLLIISEPTRGIDIAAKEKVLELIMKKNQEDGVTIIVISSELDDLRRICDRVVVLSEGMVSAILSPVDDDIKYAHALSGLDMEVAYEN